MHAPSQWETISLSLAVRIYKNWPLGKASPHCHFDEIFFIGCIGSCENNPFVYPVTEHKCFHLNEIFFTGALASAMYHYCDMTLSQDFSQWKHSFHWNLFCHWLKGLWRPQIAVVIQDTVKPVTKTSYKMSFAFQCMPYKILRVSYYPSVIKFDLGLDVVLFHAIPEPVMNNCLIEPVAWS